MTEKRININTDSVIGRIKQLHGVGGGPVSDHFSFNAVNEFHAAGIPFGRTHDIEYPFGSGEYVDIHCIFPRFDMDENDPENYNFVFTDEYLRAMLEAGTQPFYRLGTTIEHQPIKRYIMPPKDFDKWARICSHIVAHYNDGWANGYHWNIKYWEIWNEPDLKDRCWTGTMEQIFELYAKTATLLKKEHPEIKVGGLAFTSPKCAWIEPFIKYVSENALPIDFISWHGYCHNPEFMVELENLARGYMNKYGLTNVESICNEWNYVCTWANIQPAWNLIKTKLEAAFIASVISLTQDSTMDKLIFYDAQMNVKWNGLFAETPLKVHGTSRGVRILPGYWALWAWNRLYEAGDQLRAEGDKDLYVTAARMANGHILAYVSYYNDDAGENRSKPEDALLTLSIDGKPAKHITVRKAGEDGTFEPEAAADTGVQLEGNSFYLLELEA